MREGCNPDLTAAHGVPGEGQQLAVQGEASPVLLHLSPGSATLPAHRLPYSSLPSLLLINPVGALLAIHLLTDSPHIGG